VGVGVGGQGVLGPLGFKNFQQEVCFLSFERKKTNFTSFGPLPEKFWKNPLVAPPVKIFPTTMKTAFGVGDGNNS